MGHRGARATLASHRAQRRLIDWRRLTRQPEDVVTEGPPDNPARAGKESDSRIRSDLPEGFGMLDVGWKRHAGSPAWP